MAVTGVDSNSEAFRILQDNLTSARGRDMSTNDTEKAINGSKNLLKIYKEIESSLKRSSELYGKNRKSLEKINQLNTETFKNLKADSITRKQLNAINSQNIKYLDITQAMTRDALRNDIDSKKIKEKIVILNNAIAQSDRERNEEANKYNETFHDISDFVSRNKDKFNIGERQVAHYVEQIKDSEDEFRMTISKVTNATDDITKKLYTQQAEKIKSEQNKYIRELFNSVEAKNASGKILKKVGEGIKSELSIFLGEAFQSSNIVSALEISSNIASLTAKQLEAEKIKVQAIEKKIGTVGKIFDGLSKTPLNSLFDFNQAKARMKDAGATGGSPLISAGRSLLGSTPLAQAGIAGGTIMVLKEIISLMVKADDRVTKIARSFGIAKSEAGGIYDNAEGTNTELGKIGLNIDDIIDAQINFNTQFGYAVNMSDTMLKNIAQSTKLIGLSAESTNELIQQSLTTNRDINDVEADILGQLSYQSKGLLGNKVMLEKVLHITGEVRANFKGNVSDIAKATVKAKEYGTSLEKVNQIGQGLLDWESSISAELEAELITGRQINLEKARYASLMGNTAVLMEEINKNVGNFDQFSNMNVIQQESFAKALGMTREEMSNMLFEQQVNAKIIALGNKKFTEDERMFLSQSDKFKKEYNRIMNDNLLSEADKMKQLGDIARNNISQMTAQQKFEASLEKIKEKIAQLFGDGAILDKMADGLIGFMKLFGIIGEDEEKRYLAAKIIDKANPTLSAESPEYKKLLNTISGYDKASLETKNEIISLEKIYDKKSPEYKQKVSEIVGEGFGFNNGSFTFGNKLVTDILNKMEQQIIATKEAGKKTISFDSVAHKDTTNKNGLTQ